MDSDTEQQLRQRIAELEAELAGALEAEARDHYHVDGDEYDSSNIEARARCLRRLAHLGRVEITEDQGTDWVYGRFLPMEYGNGQAT